MRNTGNKFYIGYFHNALNPSLLKKKNLNRVSEQIKQDGRLRGFIWIKDYIFNPQKDHICLRIENNKKSNTLRKYSTALKSTKPAIDISRIQVAVRTVAYGQRFYFRIFIVENSKIQIIKFFLKVDYSKLT